MPCASAFHRGGGAAYWALLIDGLGFKNSMSAGSVGIRFQYCREVLHAQVEYWALASIMLGSSMQMLVPNVCFGEGLRSCWRPGLSLSVGPVATFGR